MRRAPDDRSGWQGTGSRGVVLALALAAALPAAGCRRQQADLPHFDPADLRIEIGLAGAIDSRRWSVVRVRARNRGADFRGTVEIRGSVFGTGDPVVYSVPVEIAGKGGAVREIVVPVRPRDWTEVAVAFRQAGWEAAFKTDVILSREVVARVLAVSRGARDLGALEAAISAHTGKVELIAPGELLPESLAYDAFHAIVLLGTTLGDAPQGIAEALGRWVERGGTLIAFPGPEWASGVPEATLDLLGVDLGDPEAKLPPGVAEAIGPAAARGYYRAITPRPGVRRTAEGLGLLSPRGTGRVLVFSFGPGDGRFPPFREAPGIHGTLQLLLAQALQLPAGASPFGALETEAVTTLFAMSGTFIPPHAAVALGIAVYLALGFFLPWVVFSRLRRREWTYAAVVAAAALASLGIYRFGLLSARDVMEIDEVSIVRVHHDGRAGEATSFVGVVSPRLQRRDILAGGDAPGGHLPQLLRVGEGPGGGGVRQTLGSAAIERRDGRLHLAPVTLYPNGMFYVRSDHAVGPAALPEVAFDGAGGAPPGAIRVASRGAPVTVYRAARGYFARLGRAEARNPFRGSLGEEPAGSPADQGYYPRRGRLPAAEIESRLVNAIVPLIQRDSILLVSHEGVFPPGREFPRWNGVTLLVIEVPQPPGGE